MLTLMSVLSMAGEYHLLWDYSTSAPEKNPDNGLYFASAVNDAEGVKNGLKGIKLNSSGFCYFTKAPVAGQLRLTFGARSGLNPASLQVHTWSGEVPCEQTLVGVTCEVIELRMQTIYLTAEQNNIYITRLLNMETVLQRIEFIEGAYSQPEPCEPTEISLPEVNPESLSANAQFLLKSLKEANQTGGTTIYLPNGVYDLGETVLTTISASHIAIIGESMEGVIIRNAPDYRTESIDRTATLRIAPEAEGMYLQNLTIENALDYYKNDNGRAVALWDQGTKTVCKHVRLLSHQDTYYSDRRGGLKYFEDCEIHGTVDFICGNGNVYFKRCLLYCKKRDSDGKGTDALTASNADQDDKGYVFDACTVQSECPVVSLGRSWNNHPKCVFLNTILDYSAGLFELSGKGIQRWTTAGMSTLPERFGEYNTTDSRGKVVSPATNEVTFTYRGVSKTMNTILTAEQAGVYSMDYVLGTWEQTAKQTILTNSIY